MSLFRPRWLDDILRIHPTASPRVRGLKSFEPHHVPALQDPLYADDPTFWVLSAAMAGVALNTGHIGVQTPSDDSFVTIVDGIVVSGPTADDILFQVIEGGTTLLALATDTGVFKRNRREQARTTATERTGLLRIFDNTNAFAGTTVGQVRIAAGASILVPVGFRLFGAEQFFATNQTINTSLEVMMFGRTSTKGQR